MYVVCKLTQNHEFVEIMQILGMSKGLFTLNPDSNRFSNQIAQCESNAHQSRDSCPHCIVRNRIHACTLTTPPHSYHGALVRSLLQPAIILLLELSRYVEHSV